MNKKHWILITLAVAIFLIGLTSVGIDIFIKYAEKNVTAVVTDVPNNCDRYNSIKVLIWPESQPGMVLLIILIVLFYVTIVQARLFKK